MPQEAGGLDHLGNCSEPSLMGFVLKPLGLFGQQGGQGWTIPCAAGMLCEYVAAGDQNAGGPLAATSLMRDVLQLQSISWHPDVRHNKTSEVLRLSNMYKCQYSPASVNTHPQTGLERPPKASLPVVASGLGDELLSFCERGQLDSALDVLLRMEEVGIVPSVKMYKSLLKACTGRKALIHAKRVHAHLVSHGLESTGFLGECVVGTLVKCGGLEDALQIFRRLPHRTVSSWTAVISGFTTLGQGYEALRMYNQMKEEGVQPNSYTFVSLLKACGCIPNLNEGKSIHVEALKYGCVSNAIVRTCLVDMYGKCGSILDAQKVFDELPQHDVVLWNALLAAYVDQGQPEEALKLYELMQKEGVGSTNRTFVTALQACGMLASKEGALLVDGQFIKVKSLEKGNTIIADAKTTGYNSDVFVGNTLVSLYGKCGSIVDAQNVFDGLTQRNVVSCNAMLGVYVEQNQAAKGVQLYDELLEEGVSPDAWTFVRTVQACGILADKEDDVIVDGRASKAESLTKGKEVHAHSFRSGYNSNVFLGITLITMYGKCRRSADAQTVFDSLPEPDVVAWTAMVAAYVDNAQAEEALWMYGQMREACVSPNNRTFVGVVQACCLLAGKEEYVMVNKLRTKVRSLEKGMLMHADVLRKGYHSDMFVGNTLISMYGKCGRIVETQNIFDGLHHHDVVSWTALLMTYVEHGLGEEALARYYEMQEEGVSANDRTFVTMLQLVGLLAKKEDDFLVNGELVRVTSLEKGKAIHSQVCKMGCELDVFVGSALVCMYGKCGSILDARHVFDGLSKRNVVSWNTMLAAYIEQGQVQKALQLYSYMEQENASLDEITVIWVLQACGAAGGLVMIRQLHQTLAFNEPKLSPFMASSLITAYGRCSSMVDAQTVFDSVPEADVVLWNALSAGYARQGNFGRSLNCYEKMQLLQVTPNGVTFLSLISACSHAGLVDKGVAYFASMTQDHGIIPEIEHYVSMVDLFGRAGCFTRIEDLMATMPMQPDLAMWLCLLGSCQKHGNVVLGEHAFKRAVHLQPNHGAAYVLMSNIYCDAGLLDHVEKVQLREAGAAWKQLGQSWIEHDQEVQTFLAGSGNLKQSQHHRVYDFLRETSSRLTKEGHIPHSQYIANGMQSRVDRLVDLKCPSYTYSFASLHPEDKHTRDTWRIAVVYKHTGYRNENLHGINGESLSNCWKLQETFTRFNNLASRLPSQLATLSSNQLIVPLHQFHGRAGTAEDRRLRTLVNFSRKIATTTTERICIALQQPCGMRTESTDRRIA